MNQTISPAEENVLLSGLGSKLRDAREAKNLSVEAVSKHLSLPKQMVLDLENEQFHKFPALVYVRGYLKAYLEFLGILDSAILNDFEQIVPRLNFFSPIQKNISKGCCTMLKEKTFSSSTIRFKYLMYLVVILGILVGVFLWFGQSGDVVSEKNVTPSPVQANISEPKQTTSLALPGSEEKNIAPVTTIKNEIGKEENKMENNLAATSLSGKEEKKVVTNATTKSVFPQASNALANLPENERAGRVVFQAGAGSE